MKYQEIWTEYNVGNQSDALEMFRNLNESGREYIINELYLNEDVSNAAVFVFVSFMAINL